MYRYPNSGQVSFETFNQSFGGKLSGENRWVKLSALIPWEELETDYAEQFSPTMGAPAKPFRMALGALIIKERLGTSDAETVEQIRENPYLQYFLGQREYSDQAPFDASMMVHFRKRLSLEIIVGINERIVRQAVPCNANANLAVESVSELPSERDASEESSGRRAAAVGDDGEERALLENRGQLIVDATCAPADIRYPTDLSLLNEARECTEEVIDVLYEQVKGEFKTKPRTYRREARREYLQVAKQRNVRGKPMRKAIGKQLRYLKRNLGHIDALVAAGGLLSKLDKQLYRKLLVVSELFRQQQCMYQQRRRRIDDRIVSLSQPHVRPIVRGKARTPVEFGAKISLSCVDGIVFVDHLSWDNFNESGDLPQQIEQFKHRFGHYPLSVHADQIYRTRANRDYCHQRGIRLSGKPLARVSETEQTTCDNQTHADAGVRNHIEGKFGQGKRRFSLARVMAKLAPTAQTAIAMTFLVMNLEHLLRQGLFVVVALMRMSKQRMKRSWHEHQWHQSAFLLAA